MNSTNADPKQTTELTVREKQLATLLYNARTALWREWVESGSEAAKQAFDRTDPSSIS